MVRVRVIQDSVRLGGAVSPISPGNQKG